MWPGKPCTTPVPVDRLPESTVVGREIDAVAASVSRQGSRGGRPVVGFPGARGSGKFRSAHLGGLDQRRAVQRTSGAAAPGRARVAGRSPRSRPGAPSLGRVPGGDRPEPFRSGRKTQPAARAAGQVRGTRADAFRRGPQRCAALRPHRRHRGGRTLLREIPLPTCGHGGRRPGHHRDDRDAQRAHRGHSPGLRHSGGRHPADLGQGARREGKGALGRLREHELRLHRRHAGNDHAQVLRGGRVLRTAAGDAVHAAAGLDPRPAPALPG